jgi:hypothetical protein
MPHGRDVVKLEESGLRPKKRGAAAAAGAVTASGTLAPISSGAEAVAIVGGVGAAARLGSIRPKPDLTLGGTQKTKFKPKLPARRKPRAAATAAPTATSGDAAARRRGGRSDSQTDRAAGQSRFARGQGRRPAVHSETVFGSDNLKRKKVVRKPAGTSGGGGGGSRRQSEADEELVPTDFGDDKDNSHVSQFERAQGGDDDDDDDDDDGGGDGEEQQQMDQDLLFKQWFGAGGIDGQQSAFPPVALPLTRRPALPRPGVAAAAVPGGGGGGVGGGVSPRTAHAASHAHPLGAGRAVGLAEGPDCAVGADFDEERCEQGMFMVQLPSHLPLDHYTAPKRRSSQTGGADAVDLEDEDDQEETARGQEHDMAAAMAAYEAHHSLISLAPQELQADPIKRAEHERRKEAIRDSAVRIVASNSNRTDRQGQSESSAWCWQPYHCHMSVLIFCVVTAPAC